MYRLQEDLAIAGAFLFAGPDAKQSAFQTIPALDQETIFSGTSFTNSNQCCFLLCEPPVFFQSFDSFLTAEPVFQFMVYKPLTRSSRKFILRVHIHAGEIRALWRHARV
jgi:hypothetical protein